MRKIQSDTINTDHVVKYKHYRKLTTLLSAPWGHQMFFSPVQDIFYFLYFLLSTRVFSSSHKMQAQ